MKKVFFALLGALAMTLIPQSVNATDECLITINRGETKTINYATNCRIDNYGSLNVTSGANIAKYTQDAFAAIENYGTLTISGGSVYADYGYAIRNRGGYINMYGGTVNSALHEAIWVSAGTTKVTGGTLKSAGGYEKNIYTLGKLITCGNAYTYNSGAVIDNSSCPQSKPSSNTASEKKTETITITVKSSSQKSATNSTTTTKSVNSAPAENKTEQKAEEQPVAETPAETEKQPDNKTQELVNESTNEPTLPTAGTDAPAEEKNNTFAVIVAATVAVIGSASAAILINRIRS